MYKKHKNNYVMKKEVLIRVIQVYITPSKGVYRMTSYGLKHLFEHLLDDYFSVSEFASAMKQAGFYLENGKYHIEVKALPEVPKVYWGKGYQSERRNQNGSLQE